MMNMSHSVFGHAEIKKNLMQAFSNNRLPHALLLSGPQGIGKATFAYHFAHWILSSASAQFDGVSVDDPLYKRMLSGAHADFFVLSKAGGDPKAQMKTISIDQVRHFMGQLSKTALEGGWRIALVDAVNDLNRNGANALLKTLEEPRPQTLIILIHHEGEALLPTIRSRCQKLTFKALHDKETKAVIEAQGRSVDDSKRLMVARGRPGLLIHLEDSFVGTDYVSEFLAFVQHLMDQNIFEISRYIKAVLADSNKESAFSGLDCLQWLWSWWGHVLITTQQQTMVNSTPLDPAIRKIAEIFLSHWPLSAITEFSSELAQCIKQITTFNLNETASVMNLFLDFMSLKK